jgi:hypothetical protein
MVLILTTKRPTVRYTAATGPDGAGYYAALPEPGGQRIAVSVRDPNHPQTGGFPPVDIYVVSPDGQAVELLTNVMQ